MQGRRHWAGCQKHGWQAADGQKNARPLAVLPDGGTAVSGRAFDFFCLLRSLCCKPTLTCLPQRIQPVQLPVTERRLRRLAAIILMGAVLSGYVLLEPCVQHCAQIGGRVLCICQVDLCRADKPGDIVV